MSTPGVKDVTVTEGQLDAQPVCECEFVTWKGEIPCDNPAQWWGVNLCCGERGLYCDSCKHRADGGGDFRYRLDVCGACGGRGMRWVRV